MNHSGYTIRPFSEDDRPATLALGQHVVDWWNAQCPTLHLTAVPVEGGDIIAHLQIADRSFPEPSHRPGECQLRLIVAPEHRNRGLGSALYARAETLPNNEAHGCQSERALRARGNVRSPARRQPHHSRLFRSPGSRADPRLPVPSRLCPLRALPPLPPRPHCVRPGRVCGCDRAPGATGISSLHLCRGRRLGRPSQAALRPGERHAFSTAVSGDR